RPLRSSTIWVRRWVAVIFSKCSLKLNRGRLQALGLWRFYIKQKPFVPPMPVLVHITEMAISFVGLVTITLLLILPSGSLPALHDKRMLAGTHERHEILRPGVYQRSLAKMCIDC